MIAPKSLGRQTANPGHHAQGQGRQHEDGNGKLAPYMRGWRSYFGFCETPEVLVALTRWVRFDCGPLCGVSGKHHVAAVRR